VECSLEFDWPLEEWYLICSVMQALIQQHVVTDDISDHLIAMTSWMNAKKARSWTFLRNTYTLDREVEQSRNHFDASWCRLCIPIQAQKQLPGRISLSQFYHQWTSDHFPIIESIVAKMVHHTNLCYLRDCKRVLFPSELLNRHINSIGNKIKTKWPMAYMYP